MKCPLCDKSVPRRGDRLARHLATAHKRQFPQPPDGQHWRGQLAIFGETMCICGRRCRASAKAYQRSVEWKQSLAEHLEEMGGATAHILAVTLGVQQ